MKLSISEDIVAPQQSTMSRLVVFLLLVVCILGAKIKLSHGKEGRKLVWDNVDMMPGYDEQEKLGFGPM